jgi:hypothetical protein
MNLEETAMTLSRRNRKIMGPAMMIMLIAMSGGVARAADEESVCTFLLRQIGTSIQRASSAEDDADEKAKYLQKIALMERRALQSSYPSSAAAFDNELARANQSLEVARTRSQVAGSAVNMAETAYVQQCPAHFAAIHGDHLQLVLLAIKAITDSSQSVP